VSSDQSFGSTTLPAAKFSYLSPLLFEEKAHCCQIGGVPPLRDFRLSTGSLKAF
jgi:hypothetical protein